MGKYFSYYLNLSKLIDSLSKYDLLRGIITYVNVKWRATLAQSSEGNTSTVWKYS